MRRNAFHRQMIGILALTLVAGSGLAHAGSCSGSQRADIVTTAVEAGSFDTLVAAVKAAGLVDALQADGPLTVFAPTDEAFAKLPPGTVEDLLKPENKAKLQEVLKYHVVAGRVASEQVATMNNAETLQGSNIEIRSDDSGVKIDEASVIHADVLRPVQASVRVCPAPCALIAHSDRAVQVDG